MLNSLFTWKFYLHSLCVQDVEDESPRTFVYHGNLSSWKHCNFSLQTSLISPSFTWQILFFVFTLCASYGTWIPSDFYVSWLLSSWKHGNCSLWIMANYVFLFQQWKTISIFMGPCQYMLITHGKCNSCVVATLFHYMIETKKMHTTYMPCSFAQSNGLQLFIGWLIRIEF